MCVHSQTSESDLRQPSNLVLATLLAFTALSSAEACQWSKTRPEESAGICPLMRKRLTGIYLFLHCNAPLATRMFDVNVLFQITRPHHQLATWNRAPHWSVGAWLWLTLLVPPALVCITKLSIGPLCCHHLAIMINLSCDMLACKIHVAILHLVSCLGWRRTATAVSNHTQPAWTLRFWHRPPALVLVPIVFVIMTFCLGGWPKPLATD
jgi:hypothetical protein